jgi:hypothetical protein
MHYFGAFIKLFLIFAPHWSFMENLERIMLKKKTEKLPYC